MASRYYVKDIRMLAMFRQYLTRLTSQLTNVIAQNDRAIRSEVEWIEDRKQYWAREVERRRQAYQVCVGLAVSGTQYSDCSAERQSLARAEEALSAAQKWAVRLEQAIAEYEGHAKATRRLVSAEIGKASSDLASLIAKYENYVQATSSASTSAARGGYTAQPHRVPIDSWFRPHLFSYDIRGSLFGAELQQQKPTLSDPRIGAALGFHLLKAQTTVLRGGTALSGDAFVGAKIGLNAGMKVEKSTALLNLSLETFLGGQFIPHTVVAAGRAMSVDGLFGTKLGLGGSVDIHVGIENGRPTLKFGRG